MRIKFVAALMLGMASVALSAQDFSGMWAGASHQEKDQPFLLDVRPDGNGSYRVAARLDARGADIPVESVLVKGNHFVATSRMGRFTYEGRLSKDGKTINGILVKGSAGVELALHHVTLVEALKSDTSHHTVSMIPVDKDVKLEVLDWGGSGPPMILLSGLGNNAHAFDEFAPKLTAKFHVYGISRRGFGASSSPALLVENYTADRLGDDVLAVIDALKLDRPFLLGHSIAGEELSSIGTRHPEKVRGLIYLEAGYPYAFFDPRHPDYLMTLNDLRHKLASLRITTPPGDVRVRLQQLLDTDLPHFQEAAAFQIKKFEGLSPTEGAIAVEAPISIGEVVLNGEQKYGAVKCPALFVFAYPHDVARLPKDPKVRAEAEAHDMKMVGDQVDAIAAAMPEAKIVKIDGANHFIFKSNEEQVLKEISAFTSSVK